MNGLDRVDNYQLRLQIVGLYKYILQIGFAVDIAGGIGLFYPFGPEAYLFLALFARNVKDLTVIHGQCNLQGKSRFSNAGFTSK